MSTEKVSIIENKPSFHKLLEQVERPGQYLGNEWGAIRKDFDKNSACRMVLAFPDIYELGMSNFGLKILYQIINDLDGFMVDRTYAPAKDMEALMRENNLPLWAWESKKTVKEFDLLGFSLQYELTYTNVLNMLELSDMEVFASERKNLFPLVFGGGPSSVNPEPMANFFDFFLIGDGEESAPHVMRIIESAKSNLKPGDETNLFVKRRLLYNLATNVSGVYVPSLYVKQEKTDLVVSRMNDKELREYLGLEEASLKDHFTYKWLEKEDLQSALPERVFRQVAPLNSGNQPTRSLVSYLSLVHDREVLEVRRGCDRGCRFCQPGYTFLPVRERSADDILNLSKEALSNSGHEEYSLLSLCVSDYTSLQDSVRALNREHTQRRTSLSFPSQRADRMNLDIAEELKAVRKSGITLAPEAGTERMRAVVNKGLNHQQIISAIESAYKSGWNSIKLYFMCCLPTEQDEDLVGIIDILQEATLKCREIRRANPENHKRQIEFTCTISNFVPKPFTPFQWFGQVTREETKRKHKVLKDTIKEYRLNNVTLNVTEPEISLLESVISRGDREYSELIFKAWKAGATFDAWDDQFKPKIWHEVAESMNTTLEELACVDREVGSTQPWDVIHIGLHNWWLVKEWEKAISESETANCTEHTCHACGVCTELDTVHELANPSEEVLKANPFVKELNANESDEDSHPSLFFEKPNETPSTDVVQRLRFKFTKRGDLRFIGHLDLMTLLVRAFRRAQISVAYSQGFNPSPKLSMASPLSLYMESTGEVSELELSNKENIEDFKAKVNEQLPFEVQITDVVELEQKPKESLSSALQTARYQFTLNGLFENSAKISKAELESLITNKVREITESDEILVVRTKKAKKNKRKRWSKATKVEKNIRPGIIQIEIVDNNPLVIHMELSCTSELHVKPQEVLNFINSEMSIRWQICRTELLEENGNTLLNHGLQPEEVSTNLETVSDDSVNPRKELSKSK